MYKIIQPVPYVWLLEEQWDELRVENVEGLGSRRPKKAAFLCVFLALVFIFF